MSDAVGARLAESALWGRTVSVKIRFADRQTITRSHTAADPLRASHAVSTVAQALVDAVELPQGVRLVGVSVAGLDRADKAAIRQLSFEDFGEPSAPADPSSDLASEVDDEAWLNVQEALSAIRARYGQGSVGPAALVGPGGLEAKGRGDTHWGPEADESPEDTSRPERPRPPSSRSSSPAPPRSPSPPSPCPRPSRPGPSRRGQLPSDA